MGIRVSAVLVAMSLAATLGAEPPGRAREESGRLVVKLAPGASRAPAALEPLLDEVGVKAQRPALPAPAVREVDRRFPARARRASGRQAPDLSRTLVLELEEGRGVAAALARLRGDARVEWAEPELTLRAEATTDDPYLASTGTWGQSYGDLWGLKAVGAEAAWDVTTGAGVVVAVVDTGVSRSHPDLLAANLWTNAGETGTDEAGADRRANGRDDDGNGRVDDVNGWDFAADTGGDNDPGDDHGHGTHVAGTVAATGNNAQGVVGLAWGARVMGVKCLDSGGSGYTTWIAAAIVYAVDNGADVINLSLGARGRSQLLEEAVAYAHAHGVLTVAAAGNSKADASLFTPAGIAEAVTVSAFDGAGARASFSNFGEKVDVAAPGVDVLSLQPAGTGMGTRVAEGYTRASGTSMAAPHVAGLAALILAAHPAYTPEQVRAALRASAADVDAEGWDPNSGYGRIDAAAAVAVSGALEVRLQAPAVGAVVAAPTAVSGTVGAGAVSWVLDHEAAASPGSWTVMAEGSGPFAQGALGTFDPTFLPSGRYTLRLRAWNAGGAVFTDRRAVLVQYLEITSPRGPLTPAQVTPHKPGRPLPIVGSAAGGGFLGYTVEWAPGLQPEGGWSSEGIVLAEASDGGAQPVAGGLLATWSTPASAAAGYYSIRARAERTGGAETQQTAVYLEPALAAGEWPQLVDDAPYLNIGARPVGTPTGDVLELTGGLKLRRFALDGRLLLEREVKNGIWGQMAVGELDGLPGEDSVVAEVNSATISDLRVFRADGSSFVLGSSNKQDGSSHMRFTYNPLHVADLDADGRDDVLAVAAPSAGTGRAWLFAFDRDGRSLGPNFPIELSSYDVEAVMRPRVLVVDLDRDGPRELLVAHADGKNFFRLRLYNADGSRRAWADPNLATLLDMAASDLDGDGRVEIVAATRDTYSEQRIVVLQSDGTVRPGFPVVLPPCSFAQFLAVGDLDGDGHEEIVVTAGTGLLVLRDDGRALPGWPKRADCTQSTNFVPNYSDVVLADVDGDARPEVVAIRQTATVNPLASLPGAPATYAQSDIVAFRADGSEAGAWPRFGAEGLAPVANAPLAAGDFDHDGKVDLAVNGLLSNDGVLTSLGTYRGSLTLYSLPGVPAAAPWPTRFADRGNTAVGREPSDQTPPVLTDLREVSAALRDDGFFDLTLRWTTNHAATSQAELGSTTSYGQASALDPGFTRDHLHVVRGLLPGVEYHYRARSTDPGGNTGLSADRVVTLPADGGASLVQDVRHAVLAVDRAAHAADVEFLWSTAVAADSQVEVLRPGLGPVYGPYDAAPVTSHRQVVRLGADTTYTYRVRSRDGAGRLAFSAPQPLPMPDTQPPLITDLRVLPYPVASGRLSAVEVRWTTSEPATTKVQYGSSFTAFQPALATEHSAVVSGLLPDFHYSVIAHSVDASGNAARFPTPGALGFTSPPDSAPPAITITQSYFWNYEDGGQRGSWYFAWSTDEDADAQVEYGTTPAYGSFSPLQADRHGVAQVYLGGLLSDTVYYYRLRARDANGNLGVKEGTLRTEVDWVEPKISDVAHGLLRTTAGASKVDWQFRWTTNEPATAQVFYGAHVTDPGLVLTRSTPLDATLGLAHTVDLAGLEPATPYVFELVSRDNRGNTRRSARMAFTTPADTTAPPITGSGGAPAAVRASGSLVDWRLAWTTDEASDSQVEYGSSEALGALTSLDAARVTAHAVVLPGLPPATRYFFRLRSRDAVGNLALGELSSFTTPEDRTGPAISAVASALAGVAGGVVEQIVTWTTDEAADTQVEYGPSAEYGALSPLDPGLLTGHQVRLTGLAGGTTYRFRVRSRDAAGNLGLGAEGSFTTPITSAALSLADQTSGSATHTNATTVSVALSRDTGAVAWCLSETQATAPAATSACFKAARPSAFTFTKVDASGVVADGTRTVYVWVKDGTGKVSAGPSSAAIVLDRVAPSNPAFTLADPTPTTAGYSNDPVVKITITGDTGALAWCASELQATRPGESDACFGPRPATVTLSLGDGSKRVYLWVRDAAGNVNVGPVSRTLVFDTAAPAAPKEALLTVKSNASPTADTLSGATGAVEALATVRVYGTAALAGTPLGSLKAATTGAFAAFAIGDNRSDPATNLVYVVAVDAAGNLSAATAKFNDVTPPLIGGATLPALGPSSATFNWTTDEAANAQVEYRKATVATWSRSAINGTYELAPHKVVLTGLSGGTSYVYCLLSRDRAGNLRRLCDPGFTFTTPAGSSLPSDPDTTAPSVQVVSPGAGETLSGVVTVQASASDAGGLDRVEFYVRGVLVGVAYAGEGGFAADWDTRREPDGGATVTAVAYDLAGNGAQDAVQVTVSNRGLPEECALELDPCACDPLLVCGG